MIRNVLLVLPDALVVLGVTIMTIAVYGAVSMPDVYTKLHGTSKSVLLGVLPLLLATVVTGNQGIILRAVLIAVFLILTTPVSAPGVSIRSSSM